MPIPFILGGMALAAAGYGAKKGYDANEDYNRAEEYNNRAKRVFDNSSKQLEESRKATNTDLENLGTLKASIYDENLGDFIDIFSEIKHIDFDDNLDIGTKIPLSTQDMLDMKKNILEINEILGGGLVAAGGGAAAGFGAFGSVGVLATASTGTAISGLSGVAATNATLAWLGGGSLATGGMGMAGGMAVLGGIVAGPVLAIGGFLLAADAEEAKYEARSNLSKAEAQAEQMDTARVVVEEILSRINEFDEVLRELNEIFYRKIAKLEFIVDESTDYRTYTKRQKSIVIITASIAKTIKNICDAPIIDKEGEVTRKSERVLKKATDFISKLEEV